jgi:hypothetical protein
VFDFGSCSAPDEIFLRPRTANSNEHEAAKNSEGKRRTAPSPALLLFFVFFAVLRCFVFTKSALLPTRISGLATLFAGKVEPAGHCGSEARLIAQRP